MTRRIALLTLLVAWGHSEATAQVTIAPSEPTAKLATPPPVQNRFAPITITLRPAAEPTPSLKYRLIPERRTLIAGNAVVFYHRANQFLYEKRNQLDSKDKDTPQVPNHSIELQISRWNTEPIADIPKDVAKSTLVSFEMALKEAELGAKRASCDWEYDQRTEGISLLLPEIQAMRSLARLIVLRIKVAILEGKTDEAMHWIEVGFVVGRHVGQGPYVIQSLVGVAISSEMAKCLDDLIQAPGTPSLFWTLADRPRPFGGKDSATPVRAL